MIDSINAQLGQGYDSFTGQIRSQAVNITQGAFQDSRQGYFRICTDYNSLFEALNISASISGSIDLIDKADAKMDFFHSLLTTEYALTLVIYVANKSKYTYTDRVVIKESIAPVDKQDVKRFFDSYGDCFVNEVSQGGELIGCYTFFSSTELEQMNVKTELNASGIGEDFSFDAKFSTNFQEATARIDTTKTFHYYMKVKYM